MRHRHLPLYMTVDPVGLCDYYIVDYKTPELAIKAFDSILREPESYARSITIIDAEAAGWSYAQSANNAAEHATAPFICICNADVEMRSSQNAVFDLLTHNPKIAAVGPLQYDSEGIIRHAGIFGPNNAPAHRFFGDPVIEHMEALKALGAADCTTISGSVYFAPREKFIELGGFLETPHFYEETWFSYYARHKGYQVVFTPMAEWLHHWDSSLPVRNVEPAVAAANQNRKSAWFEESRNMFRLRCREEGILCD